MKPVYITHSSAISPQYQSDDSLLQPLVPDSESHFYVKEPDYSTVIPPMQLRRMSRILKMGVYCGMSCLQEAGLERPDGIVTGTGKGSMVDTEKFVKELKQYNEEALNPTPFILSTYNAINGAIALQTKATGYNQTYVHRGSSFEVALYDIQLKLHTATGAQHYLAGCFDEITPEYFFVKGKIGYWKEDRNPQLPLWEQDDTPGSIAGEGAAFFTISNNKEGSIAGIHAVHCSYKSSATDITGAIAQLLDKAGWQMEEIDLLVLGLNGDSQDTPFYRHLLDQYDDRVPVLAFKHLCGEYETSGGFALWLTCQLLNKRELPDTIWFRKPAADNYRPRKILYYNHYRGLNHNAILLSASS